MTNLNLNILFDIYISIAWYNLLLKNNFIYLFKKVIFQLSAKYVLCTFCMNIRNIKICVIYFIQYVNSVKKSFCKF